MSKKHVIVTGDTFGRWEVTQECRVDSKLMYEVVCQCGKTSKVESSHLVSGRSKSCGCLHKEIVGKQSTKHGMTKSKTYKSWEMMAQRCNGESEHFLKYRIAGITVCDEWRNDFMRFLTDMGERPEGTTLDRIDGKLGYYKENCRWANTTLQAVNKGNQSNNTSGVKGVSWDTSKNRWRATLTLKGIVLLDKIFTDKADAISARLLAESLYFKPILEDIS